MYSIPFNTRYCSKDMLQLFSREEKYRLWRELWVALATAQQRAGLPIDNQQIAELRKAAIQDIDFDRVRDYERESRHEVMAHIRALADEAPRAAPIIHLGATSVFVMDNGDLIRMRRALTRIRDCLLLIIDCLVERASQEQHTPCLAYTHLQPAQPTTFGKRMAQWADALLGDCAAIIHLIDELPFRGLKGASGTQASYKELGIDRERMAQLEHEIASAFEFTDVAPLTAQNYDRKIDYTILTTLSMIAQSAHKFGTDIRLLQGLGECEERFAEQQVGSSAMPYKRNPIRSERLCSLAKFLIALPHSAALVSSTQWLEHTLDDSAARRLHIPQAFLAADAILLLYYDIIHGLSLNYSHIEHRLHTEAPFFLCEGLLMRAVIHGADRQKMHEILRRHAMTARNELNSGGERNRLYELLADDAEFPTDILGAESDIDMRAHVGYAAEQVEEWIRDRYRPFRETHTVTDAAMPAPDY